MVGNLTDGSTSDVLTVVKVMQVEKMGAFITHMHDMHDGILGTVFDAYMCRKKRVFGIVFVVNGVLVVVTVVGVCCVIPKQIRSRNPSRSPNRNRSRSRNRNWTRSQSQTRPPQATQ